MKSKTQSRRDFLRVALGSALGSSGLYGATASLQVAQAAPSLAERLDDYKALVCVFLKGGNDSFNMVIPNTDSAYDTYSQSRSDIALAREDLLVLGDSGFGMNPDSAGFASLFEQQKLAVIANVGSLVEPATKQSILDGDTVLPPQLFSHNDQQRLWMTGDSLGDSPTGWAGRLADLFLADGVSVQPALNLSFGSSDLMQMGINTRAYSLANDGVLSLRTTRNTVRDARLHEGYVRHADQGQSHLHPMVREFARIQAQSMTSGDQVASALSDAPAIDAPLTVFAKNSLAAQLETTARMIASQQTLGSNRQIFFITTGSWDTHANQAESHSFLQQVLTTNLLEFQSLLESLGVDDQVTTFTATEFGRTLSSNGDGTDHGWGGHSFVMGSQVDGGNIFGQMPSLELGSDDDLGKGRVIPTTAADQYSATLAKWFGLNDEEILNVFPRLSNFDVHDLGFMKTV